MLLMLTRQQTLPTPPTLLLCLFYTPEPPSFSLNYSICSFFKASTSHFLSLYTPFPPKLSLLSPVFSFSYPLFHLHHPYNIPTRHPQPNHLTLFHLILSISILNRMFLTFTAESRALIKFPLLDFVLQSSPLLSQVGVAGK